MPLARYKIRSEYSLADPELHRAADKDDPEALLEAVAMAGLVGVLRQLGDLAEFAAEIFHDLHEEVMATSARGHGLMARVQQIEAEFPSIEKAFFSQTSHSSFFFNAGIDWHPNLQCEQNVVTREDLPRFVMDSYEECRGPPRLFLLDKFDVAGAGACLKRYTDPSFIKMEAASTGIARTKGHRETRMHKVKQKKGKHRRNGETPEVGARTKLHHLLLEERLENAYTGPARLVKLKKRQLNGFVVEAKTGRSYMKKFLETPSPDHKIVCETSMIPLHLKLTSDDTNEAGVRILEISTFSPVKRTIEHESIYSSPYEQELGLRPFSDMDGEADENLVKVHGERPPGVMDKMPANHLEAHKSELAKDGQKKIEGSIDSYNLDAVASEVDNHLDALTAMDSDMETYNEYRLKYSFLNVQRPTDADGKEEHQLQARFSDSQSFGDSSILDKNGTSKGDKNEEPAEMRAHFSDSESIGTYSTSDDNSSFKRDRNEGLMELQADLSDSQPIEISLVSEKTNSPKRDINPERMELQPHLSDSQSIGNSTSGEISSMRKDRTHSSHNDSLGPVVEDIESDGCNTPGLLLSIKNSLVKTDGGKFVRQGNEYVKEEEIPDSGQASFNSYLMNSGHMSLGSDVETIMSVARSAGTQFQEKPSDSIEHYSKLSDDEDRKYVVEPIARVPNALSQKEDACPVVSFENGHVRTVGDAASYVDSNASLQVSYVLESTPEDQRHVHWKTNMFPDEDQNGSLVERSSYPSMAVDLSLRPMLPPNCLDSKSEDVFKATQLSIKDLSTVVETPKASDFEGEQFSDLAYGSPQDEPGSERVQVLYHDQQAHLQQISRMVQCDEINAFTYSVDAVEDNCHFEHPSSSDYGRQNNHIMLCDVGTEKADSEDKVVSVVPSADNIENDANVTYTASGLKSSTNLANLQERYLGSSESYQMQMESDEIESIETFTDLDTGRRDNQLEQSSDLTPSNIISSPTWDLRDPQQFLSDSVDIHGKENRVNEAVASESLSELKAQKVVDQCEVASNNIISAPMKNLTNSEESLSNYMDHHQKEVEAHEGIGKESLAEPDESKFVDQLEVASADVKPSLSSCGFSETTESETCIIEHSSLMDQILHHSVSDATTWSNFSRIDIQESESKSLIQNGPLQDGKDDKSLAYYNQLGFEISSDQFLQSQVGQKHAEFVLINEEKYNSENLQSTQNELEKEGSSHATSESVPDIHSDQTSSQKLLSESAGQEINPIKHDINPLKPLLSAYYPKPAHINLENMPPMPPLPPMQWRMNKVQNISLASQRELEVSQTSFLPIQPIKTDETTKFSLSGSEQTWQYQNPYLPVMAVEGDGLQHSSGFSMGFPGHPVAIPLQQFPAVFNEPNSPYSYLYLHRSSQYLHSPIVSFPVISTGRPPHSDQIASEGEVAQYPSPGTPVPSFDHDSVQEKVNQPSSQIAAGTNSVQEKVIQPSSQMVADTNSESEALGQSTSNLQGEQEGPVISSRSPTSMETVLPNVNTLPSEGEMALSSDTSNPTSGFEGKMPNGKTYNKLPRPQSPLVDAVAAHDKSKLRKVVELVRPRMAPKEDEKDSFLELIRAKSFNLKPASVTRPNIRGPKTNLNVVAILEKANAIRQAFAGSDEDDDADSWSDS